LAFWPGSAEAIPAFARRYQTSCTTCHVVIPKLNAFGIAFRNNGYRIPPNDEKFVKTPDVQLGAPAWKRVWPDAVWPGGIPGVAPLAIRLFSDIRVNPTPPSPATPKIDFVFPNEFEFLVGGTAGENISYWGELEITSGDRLDLIRAFAQFDHIKGTTLANLVVGRFEPRAVPFSRFYRRVTQSDVITTSFAQVSGGHSFRQMQAGFEFWGAKSGPKGKGGVEYATGVVNGNGPFGDNNTAKDVYYRLSYKVGGFGVTGSEEETEELAQTNNWRDNSVKMGTFGHVGKGLFGTPAREDKFWRVGADVDFFVRDLNLYGAVMRGRDKMPATGVANEFTAAFLQADYVVKPWILAVVRYDAVFRDRVLGPDIKKVVPALIFAIRANVRIVGESELFLQKSGDTYGRARLDILF
jgi:hypothetical protein